MRAQAPGERYLVTAGQANQEKQIGHTKVFPFEWKYKIDISDMWFSS